MALGLKNSSINQKTTDRNTTTLLNVLANRQGFSMGYLPEVRELDGQMYIRTFGRGNDIDNKPVFYKWIFIDPKDMSATVDSDSEYALIPNEGFIMRIMQRSLLPYHENFVIDYYEDINAIKVITIDNDEKEEFANKINGTYRTFRVGDFAVPSELKSEIYTYPKEFFKQYIEAAIPLDLLYNKTHHESNHMSSYGSIGGSQVDMSIMSHGLSNQPVSRNNIGNPRSLQNQIGGVRRNQFAGTGIRTSDQVMNIGAARPINNRPVSASSMQDIINRQIPR